MRHFQTLLFSYAYYLVQGCTTIKKTPFKHGSEQIFTSKFVMYVKRFLESGFLTRIKMEL